MEAPPYTLTNESISVIWEGKPHVVQKGSPNFLSLRSAIINEQWDEIQNHLTVKKSLTNWVKGKFTVEGDSILHEGSPLPEDLNDRILKMAAKGDDPEALMGFWEKLKLNPSYRSVNQLWSFLQHQGIPLTEDGHFLAYKAVRTSYKDVHSGNFDNKPGCINEMPRNQISDDPRQACHEGFHVGALEYARSFHSGGRIVICKVSPTDVVCVPYDSSAQKMRVCKYEVIGNHNGAHLPSTVFKEEKYEEKEEDTYDNCEECGGDIPTDVPSEVNSFHESSCSLYEEAGKDKTTSEEDEDPDYDEVAEPLLPEPGDESENEDAEETEPKNYFLNEAHELPKEEKRKSKRGFARFDKMGLDKLLEEPLQELRIYAFKGLQIVGASKIPGGKVALVSRILEVRVPPEE